MPPIVTTGNSCLCHHFTKFTCKGQLASLRQLFVLRFTPIDTTKKSASHILRLRPLPGSVRANNQPPNTQTNIEKGLSENKTPPSRLVWSGSGQRGARGRKRSADRANSGESVSLPPSVTRGARAAPVAEEEDTFRDFLPGTSTAENEKEAKQQTKSAALFQCFEILSFCVKILETVRGRGPSLPKSRRGRNENETKTIPAETTCACLSVFIHRLEGSLSSLFERSKNNQRNGLRGEAGGSFVPGRVLLPLPLEEAAAPADEKQGSVSDVNGDWLILPT